MEPVRIMVGCVNPIVQRGLCSIMADAADGPAQDARHYAQLPVVLAPATRHAARIQHGRRANARARRSRAQKVVTAETGLHPSGALGQARFQRRQNVSFFEEGIVLKDFLMGSTRTQQAENIRDTDALPTDARTPAAFAGLDGDSL